MDRAIFDRKIKYFRSKQPQLSSNKGQGKTPNWWTPVWRGLIADPNSKHRKTMGTSVWMFLYLLTYANRKTGIVRRSLTMMAKDTGYPVRTIQFNLKNLREKGYLTSSHEGRYLTIQVEKWKAFHYPIKSADVALQDTDSPSIPNSDLTSPKPP